MSEESEQTEEEGSEECECTCGDCEEDMEVSIKASLGGLELDVSGPENEAEAIFERVWEERLNEAEDMSDALRERMLGFV